LTAYRTPPVVCIQKAHAGIRQAADATRLLADLQHGQIPPGSLILADEASMISLTHLAAITR
jgi:hypothetical protein